MSTASTIIANIRSLAQRNGEIDKTILSSLESVKNAANNVTTTMEGAETSVANFTTTLATAQTKADEALDTAITAETIVGSKNATLVGVPSITGSTAVIGTSNTFVVSATPGLSNTQIVSFTVGMTGQSNQTVSASNNSAAVSFTVPSGTTVGTTLTITATATDNNGNVSQVGSKVITTISDYVKKPSILSPVADSTLVKLEGITINSSAFDVMYTTDTHASTDWKITSDAAGNTVVVSSMGNTTDKTSHTFTATDLTNVPVGTYYVWVRHNGTELGSSEWSNGIQVNLVEGEEYNGFILYRSPNNVATTILYHWPNADGTMGELRKMEVIDAAYRFQAAYASSNYNYDMPNLDNFSTAGNDGTWFVYNRNTYSRTDAIPTNVTAFQNSGICSQWRNLSTDKTAKYNTDQWMSESRYNGSSYAPAMTRAITVDSGNWDIPNEFQLIVIWCCSDKLDEMDPTFSSNKDYGLGYQATNGRFYMGTYGIVLSSTEYDTIHVRCVPSHGGCSNSRKNYSLGVVPIRELS